MIFLRYMDRYYPQRGEFAAEYEENEKAISLERNEGPCAIGCVQCYASGHSSFHVVLGGGRC